MQLLIIYKVHSTMTSVLLNQIASSYQIALTMWDMRKEKNNIVTSQSAVALIELPKMKITRGRKRTIMPDTTIRVSMLFFQRNGVYCKSVRVEPAPVENAS